MKVILLQDVAKIGRKFETKEVAPGYALNFLIKRGLAENASPVATKRAMANKARLEAEQKIQDELLAKNLDGLDKLTIHIKANANEQGHLFAGIHNEQIAKALAKESRLNIPASAIVLPKQIKSTGEFKIPVAVAGKETNFKLIVSAA